MADNQNAHTQRNAQNQRETPKKLNSHYSMGFESDEYFDTCSHLLILIGYTIMILTFPFLFFIYLRIARHYERIVVFRLGRLREIKGPGLCYTIPLIDRYKRVDLRLISVQIPTQEILSKDRLCCEVDSVVFFRVSDPVQAIINLENAKNSTKLLAQTTLRSVLGTYNITEMLTGRESISKQIQSTLDHITNEWGIKIERFELKNIHLPAKLKHSLAAQTEADQESQAKLVAAEAEVQKSESLCQAAKILTETPGGLQLRYLQSLDAIGADQKSNIVWPLPMDMMGSFYSSKSSLDLQPHNEFRREEVNKKPAFQNRQPRPEAPSPPKVLRKEHPMTRQQNATVSTTQSSGAFVPATNAAPPANVMSREPVVQQAQMPQSYRQSSFNNEPNSFMPPTVPNQQQPSFAPPTNYQSNGSRLATPPVTSTIASNVPFRRPSSATLTEICTTDDEEQTQPIQQPSQTPVFNYVH